MLFKELINLLFPKKEPYRHKYLEAVGEDVFFHHKGVRYQITSHPFEPCTYITLNGEVVRTIHVAFEVSDIIQLIRKGYSMTSITGSDIRYEQLRHILAWVIDSDRTECDFAYAETKTHKTIIPHYLPVERASVCAGDDAMAPHPSQLLYYCDTLLSNLMHELLSYLPDMRNREWEIIGDKRHLATISFSSTGEFSYRLLVKDCLITDLHISKLYCRYV